MKSPVTLRMESFMLTRSHAKKILIISMFLIGIKTDIYAKSDTYEQEVGNKEEEIEQPRIGNFALPTAQQPTPLVSFGQNIVDEKDLKLFTYAGYLRGHKKLFAEVIPAVLYGIKDRLSVFVGLPIAAKFRDDCQVSSGPEDIFVQFEGAIYSEGESQRANMVTLVANITAPTGLALDVPPTGSDAPTFFLGFTAAHFDTVWYYFVSAGGLFPTSHKCTKFGNHFLYQAGLGRNIWYVSDKWIFNWLIELDGHYSKRDILKCQIDCDSGGEQVLLGPSLFLSGQHITVQLGISWVITQHLFGMQGKDHYLLAANVGWKF